MKNNSTGCWNKEKIPPHRIAIEQTEDKNRYNKLKTESKLLINIIKMICYRAEPSPANLLTNTLKAEKRMCINNADIIPDYGHKTLTVTLHAMSAKRYNEAITSLCESLNQTQTIFPGTGLTMIFKTTPFSPT